MRRGVHCDRVGFAQLCDGGKRRGFGTGAGKTKDHRIVRVGSDFDPHESITITEDDVSAPLAWLWQKARAEWPELADGTGS